MRFVFFLALITFPYFAKAQQALDFGIGTTLSVGLQDEWAVNIRSQYHHDKWGFLAGYSLFFRRDVTSQNTETYSDVDLSFTYNILNFSGITILGGIGYTGNNFPVINNNSDTSSLFFETGKFNHGAQLKFLGFLPIGERVKLYAELNLKSFGRRYDTFAFGLVYTIPKK